MISGGVIVSSSFGGVFALFSVFGCNFLLRSIESFGVEALVGAIVLG